MNIFKNIQLEYMVLQRWSFSLYCEVWRNTFMSLEGNGGGSMLDWQSVRKCILLQGQLNIRVRFNPLHPN